MGLGEYTCGKWVQTFIEMYFVRNIHRLPAGNREGREGWEGLGWGSTRAGNREGREGCVDSWSISVENGFKLLIDINFVHNITCHPWQ